MTHTPTPWTAAPSHCSILGNPQREGYDDKAVIADFEPDDRCAAPENQQEDNRALALRAVNCHEELVTALEDGISRAEFLKAEHPEKDTIMDAWLIEARAALAKVHDAKEG